MFRITGKSISNRATASRTGLRARRLPSIVLSSGAVIKIHPNRQVLITEDDLRANLSRLIEVSSYISVSRGVPPFSEISLLELGQVATPEPEPEIVPEPEPEAPKKKRKRRTKAEMEAARAAKARR